jgi:hypothetical protein
MPEQQDQNQPELDETESQRTNIDDNEDEPEVASRDPMARDDDGKGDEVEVDDGIDIDDDLDDDDDELPTEQDPGRH